MLGCNQFCLNFFFFFLLTFQGPYPRGGQGERRPPFGRPDEEFGRSFDYDNSRFYPNGAPRNYHGEDQRGYHGDGHHNFPNEHRGGPPGRRVSFRDTDLKKYIYFIMFIFFFIIIIWMS